MADSLVSLTAVEVRQAYDAEKFSVEQYANALLSHIRTRDPIVKAWVYLDPEKVLEQARLLDRIPKDARGPLHGVALGIKDVILTKGLPTQYNSPIYQNNWAEVDAASVSMLRKAGALIVGKTTTTEFAAASGPPATTNPHNVKHTPGGSSAGSAAAVADFQIPLSLGTQTGGSTIRPASFNGIYGFKPTWNIVSAEGQKTYSINLDTLGMFARSIADLELLGSVFGILGSVPTPLPLSNGTQSKTFAFLETPVWDRAQPATQKAMKAGFDLLHKAGIAVETIVLSEDFNRIADWHAVLMKGDGSVAFRSTHRINKEKLGPELVDAVENPPSKEEYLTAFDGVAALRPKWDMIAKKYAAVIVPSAPGEAPEGLRSTGDMIFCGLWTALHVPIINIPAFRGEHGLPVGLSLTTARHHDQALLSVAKQVSDIWMAK